MDNLVFEEIQEEHLGEVLAIYNEYVHHSTATFHTQALTMEEMKEIVFFSDSKYKTYVIINDNEICGYVLLTSFKKREAYDTTAEVTIYLKSDYTGLGIGGKAIDFIENVARKKNMHALMAIICGENIQSIRLFIKNGYEKCAHYKEVGIKFGRYLDVVVYQKIIL